MASPARAKQVTLILGAGRGLRRRPGGLGRPPDKGAKQILGGVFERQASLPQRVSCVDRVQSLGRGSSHERRIQEIQKCSWSQAGLARSTTQTSCRSLLAVNLFGGHLPALRVLSKESIPLTRIWKRDSNHPLADLAMAAGTDPHPLEHAGSAIARAARPSGRATAPSRSPEHS